MRLKPLIITIGFLLIGPLTKAAETFYAPSFCPREDLKILVQNKGGSNEKWWTQVHSNGVVKERYQEIEAHSEMKIPGSAFLAGDHGFSLKAATAGALNFTALCEDQKVLLSSTTSPQVTHYLPPQQKSAKLFLLNLYLKANAITLRSFDSAGVLIEEKALTIDKHYDTATLKLSFNRDISRIDISATARLHSEVLFGDDQKQSPPLHTPVTVNADENKKYFLVSTKAPSENGSFVIGLDESETIATAREQIRNPELEKIVVARIALGSGLGVNRNFQSRDKAPYSWTVTYVDSFGDFAHLDCDGNPDLVEERLQQRLSDGGRICFWRYRVVRELTPAEVSTGRLNP